jgi:hypothetical protein
MIFSVGDTVTYVGSDGQKQRWRGHAGIVVATDGPPLTGAYSVLLASSGTTLQHLQWGLKKLSKSIIIARI